MIRIFQPREGGAGVDLEGSTDALPERTGVLLQEHELVATIDAAPAKVREELRSMDRV